MLREVVTIWLWTKKLSAQFYGCFCLLPSTRDALRDKIYAFEPHSCKGDPTSRHAFCPLADCTQFSSLFWMEKPNGIQKVVRGNCSKMGVTFNFLCVHYITIMWHLRVSFHSWIEIFQLYFPNIRIWAFVFYLRTLGACASMQIGLCTCDLRFFIWVLLNFTQGIGMANLGKQYALNGPCGKHEPTAHEIMPFWIKKERSVAQEAILIICCVPYLGAATISGVTEGLHDVCRPARAPMPSYPQLVSSFDSWLFVMEVLYPQGWSAKAREKFNPTL